MAPARERGCLQECWATDYRTRIGLYPIRVIRDARPLQTPSERGHLDQTRTVSNYPGQRYDYSRRRPTRQNSDRSDPMTTETLVKTVVVDADGYVLEPPTALVDYIDPAFKDRAPRIVERDGKEYWAGDHWFKFMPTGLVAPEGPVSNLAGMAGVGRWK